MKRVKLLLIATAIAVTTACNFEIPERISIKTNAEYQFNIGDVNKSFDDKINTNDLVKSENLGIENAKIYSYFPGEKNYNVQQYLIKMPLMEIPVDIGQYYQNSGISSAVQDMSFEKEVEIPSIKVDNKTNIDMTEVNNALNTMFTFGGVVGNGQAQFGTSFNSVEYESGYITIEVSGGIADGTTVTVKGRQGTFSSNKATVNISGMTFGPNDVTVNFSCAADLSKNYTGTINNGSKVKKASGVTYPTGAQPPLNIPVTSKVTLPNSFVNATVKEGTLVTAVNLPWSGATVNYNVNTSGAMTVSGTGNINLADKVISSGDVNINAPVTVSFNNATINFDTTPNVEVKTEINDFKEVVINADDIETSMNKAEDFSSDVYDSVKEIKLIPSGLKGTYTNTFPAGNDFQILANSDFFGIAGGSTTLESQKTDAEFAPIMSSAGFSKVVEPVAIANHNPASNKYGKWDFAMDIVFPRPEGDPNPNHIAVKNVKPGEKYKIAMNCTPELNWEYVKIIPPNQNNTGEKSLGINFSSLFDSISDALDMDFVSKVKLVSVPVYIRAEKPTIGDSFNGLNFTGKVNLLYGKDDGAGNFISVQKNGNDIKKELLPAGSTMRFVEGIPEYKMKNKALITDVGKYDASLKDDLAGLINETLGIADGELYIDYDIGLSGAGSEITVTKEQCEGSASSSIAVIALIDMPLQFQVASNTDPIVFDMMKFLGSESDRDLFEREKAETVFEGDLLNAIESCKVKYVSEKVPFYSEPSIQLKLIMYPGEAEKTTNINAGEVSVRRPNMQKILGSESYPYMPGVTLEIPPSAIFSLPRELELKMNLSFVVNTDGTINLVGGNK